MRSRGRIRQFKKKTLQNLGHWVGDPESRKDSDDVAFMESDGQRNSRKYRIPINKQVDNLPPFSPSEPGGKFPIGFIKKHGLDFNMQSKTGHCPNTAYFIKKNAHD